MRSLAGDVIDRTKRTLRTRMQGEANRREGGLIINDAAHSPGGGLHIYVKSPGEIRCCG